MAPSSKILTGLIGANIIGSASPFIHVTEAANLGLKLTYKRFDLDDEPEGIAALPRLVREIEARGFVGVNITHPAKQAVIPLLDELSEDARLLSAVNTVLFRQGRRIGYNTDWSGFRENFTRQLPDAPLGVVVQMGAGGAGAAIAYALLEMGAAHVLIFDVDLARARDLVGRMSTMYPGRVAAGTDLSAAMAAADGVVNTTPLGMDKYPGTAVPVKLLRPEMWVADIVYVPRETALLRAARALGCRTADGGGMVVFQAAEAFRLFTDVAPDAERMLSQFQAR